MSTAELGLAPWPALDHSAFGEVETRPISKIQGYVAANLSRNWVRIPHVTHQDEADITTLERARKQLGQACGAKITPLPYLMKAAAKCLQAMPQFNVSISADGQNVIHKRYCHIGFAADTPMGLLVPVIRDVDQKSIVELAAEIGEVTERARSKGLPMDKMVGGCFTISSLGPFGGTGFTPIINAPEAAIMGITRAVERPTRGENDSIVWRTMLPLSLSYDHRLLNGVDAARFCRLYAETLSDPSALH